MTRKPENGLNGQATAGQRSASASEHLNRFLAFVLDPTAGCMELLVRRSEISKPANRIERGDRFPATYGGCFNDPSKVANAIKRLGKVSAEVTINPVKAEFVERVNGNCIARIAKGDEVKTQDVACLRYLLIAVESARVSGTGTTAEELEATVRIRDAILDAYPEFRDNAIWGCSGTGSYVFVKYHNLVNNSNNIYKIKSTLERLASKFGKKSRDGVYINAGLFQPEVHIGLPGTIWYEGKGSETRPYRQITVDGGGESCKGIDLDLFARAGRPAGVRFVHDTAAAAESQTTAAAPIRSARQR